MKFEDYIKGKSVIFVGPSPILLGKKMGKFIDSFDIVIKTNDFINIKTHEKYINDYGKRNDIICLNMSYSRSLHKHGFNFVKSIKPINGNR